MCEIHKKSVDKILNSLETKIKLFTKLKYDNIKWSEPKGFDEVENGISNVIGCYKVIYKPTGEVKSIGQGRVGNRKSRHKSIFLNDGQDILHENGSTSGSKCGREMYKFDPNINNWMFSWCDTKYSEVAKQYENDLIEFYTPEFNSLQMAGK